MFRKKIGRLRKQVMATQDSQFDEEWRKMKWDEKQDLEQKLRDFHISSTDVQQVRILLVGPDGAGKSSFINSVNNAFQGRITSEALADTTAGKSFTKEYKSHYIKGKDGNPLPFLFNDVMGLASEHQCGAQEEDIVKALQGFVEDGFKFNPESPISTDDQRYRSNPELKYQVFCMVYVLPADKISLMERKVFDKIKRIREKASELHIPQTIVMTKTDEACPLVKKHLKKIYLSKKIKQKMQECSNLVGVPMNHVFPVKNYHEEIDTENDIDVLILKALDHIVNIGNDLLNKARPNTCEQ